MHIVEVWGWDDIGYAEESLEVPYEPLDKPFDHHYDELTIHTPANRLFSLFMIKAKYEDWRNVKYIKVKYDSLSDFYYGWVEAVGINTEEATFIEWHVDNWRTFIKKASIINAWVKHRPLKNSFEEPPFKVPFNRIGSGVEDVPLCGQIKGVCWGIITYLANSEREDESLDNIEGFPQWMDRVRNKVMGWAQQGLRDKFGKVGGIGEFALNTAMRRFAGNLIPWVTNKSEHVRCMTIPLLVDIAAQPYFRDFYFDYHTFAKGVSLQQVLSGSLAKMLSLTQNHYIGGFISPVPPLRVTGGNGVRITNPIIVRQDQATNYPVSPKCTNKFAFKVIGNKVFVDVDPYGYIEMGPIEEGCPGMLGALENYYLAYRGLAHWDSLGHIVPYKITLPNGGILEIDDTNYPYDQRKAPQPGEPGKVRYIRLRDIMRRHNAGNAITALLYPVNKFGIYFPMYTPKTWKWKVEKIGELHYKWSFDASVPSIYFPQAFPAIQWGFIRRVGDEWGYSTAFFDEPLYYFKEEDIWFEEDMSDADRHWDGRREDLGSSLYFFGFKERKQKGIEHLLDDDVPHLGIENYGMMWPVIHEELPYEMWGDDSRDLVILDPDGRIIHTFKKFIRYRKYSHEVIMGTSSAYVRLIFYPENVGVTHPGVSDSIVVLPLPPLPMFTTVMNEYIASGQQSIDEQHLINQEEDRKQNLQNSNLDTFSEMVQGSVSSLMTGNYGGLVGNLVGGAMKMFSGTKLGERRMKQANEAAKRDQALNNKAKEELGMELMGNGTTSWIHTFGGIRITYAYRDNYSMLQYYRSLNRIGTEVNEFTKDLDISKGGPYQVSDLTVVGAIPQQACSAIRDRLKQGVFVDLKL